MIIGTPVETRSGYVRIPAGRVAASDSLNGDCSNYQSNYVVKDLLEQFIPIQIIIVVVFQGIGLLACSGSEFYFLKLMNLFRQMLGLLGWGIGSSQGLYLHRTT
jgi:hypothetical protein